MSSSRLFKPYIKKMEYNTVMDFTFIAGTCAQIFTKTINELYPQVGKMSEQAGLAYQPRK